MKNAMNDLIDMGFDEEKDTGEFDWEKIESAFSERIRTIGTSSKGFWPHSLIRKAFSGIFKLPSIQKDVQSRDAMFTTPSGISLHMTHYYPKEKKDLPLPTILIRTPYYRQLFSFLGDRLASHDYHVIIQDCRRRFVKENEEEFPLEGENLDGADTIQWIEKQDFFNGKIGMYGISYLGLTQFAVVDELKKRNIQSLKAIVPVNSSSRVYDFIYPNGVLHLDLLTNWLHIMLNIQVDEKTAFQRLLAGFSSKSFQKRAYNALPISSLDLTLFGRKINFIREIIEHSNAEDDFWNNPVSRMQGKLCSMKNAPPTLIIAGWYDCFFRASIQDYIELNGLKEEKNHLTWLTIGPWNHWNIIHQLEISLQDALLWFDIHLKGSLIDVIRPKPVKIYVLGAEKWFWFDSFPPVNSDQRIWYLEAGEKLRISNTIKDLNTSRMYAHYKYDPRDPTPSIGGASFDFSNSGKKKQNSIEQRSDILVFTSDVLQEPLLLVGFVTVTLYVWSTNPQAHFVARLCEVDTVDNSYILCDGLCRLKEAISIHQCDFHEVQHQEITQIYQIRIDLSAVGALIKAGHRIRLHICSAAHPRWLRNLNSLNDSNSSFEQLNDSDQIVFLRNWSEKLEMTSYISLPVVSGSINDEDWEVL